MQFRTLHINTCLPSLILALAMSIPGLPVLADELTEGFEVSPNAFTCSPYNGVTFLPSATDAHRTGASSFRVDRTGCGADCYPWRVDLVHALPDSSTLVGVDLWALEASTSGYGWGGKIRVGHDTAWNLDWWGVINNNAAVTGQWMNQFVPVEQPATNIIIEVFDMTNRSTIWLDDIVVTYVRRGVVSTEHLSWGDFKVQYR